MPAHNSNTSQQRLGRQDLARATGLIFARYTMVLRCARLPFYLLLALALVPPVLSAGTTWDYCIVGAGYRFHLCNHELTGVGDRPAGLQMGALLQHKQRDYVPILVPHTCFNNFLQVIFERNSAPGSFFDLYPRHRQLNSINKQHIPGHQGNDSEYILLRPHPTCAEALFLTESLFASISTRSSHHRDAFCR